MHQFDEVVEENVAVAVAEAVDFVADFAGVVVDDKARLPRLEMLMSSDSGAEFLCTTRQKKKTGSHIHFELAKLRSNASTSERLLNGNKTIERER